MNPMPRENFNKIETLFKEFTDSFSCEALRNWDFNLYDTDDLAFWKAQMAILGAAMHKVMDNIEERTGFKGARHIKEGC